MAQPGEPVQSVRTPSRRWPYLRIGGLAASVAGFAGSLYAFVEIEVLGPWGLTYHLLGWSISTPIGRSGTAVWPFTDCFVWWPPPYGIPGQGCLFVNYDEMLLFFALLMGSGLLIWFSGAPEWANRRLTDRVTWGLVRSTHLMAIYVAVVVVWCIGIFGALPTWDQSVIWAASASASYPAPDWDPISGTCLIGWPGRTILWPSCALPNFLECLFIAVLAAIYTHTLTIRYTGRLGVELP